MRNKSMKNLQSSELPGGRLGFFRLGYLGGVQSISVRLVSVMYMSQCVIEITFSPTRIICYAIL